MCGCRRLGGVLLGRPGAGCQTTATPVGLSFPVVLRRGTVVRRRSASSSTDGIGDFSGRDRGGAGRGGESVECGIFPPSRTEHTPPHPTLTMTETYKKYQLSLFDPRDKIVL